MSLREPCRAHFSVVAGAWSPAPWEVLTAAASAGAESPGWPCKLAVVSRVWHVGGGVGTGGTVPQPRVGGRSRAPRLGCAGSLCHPPSPQGGPPCGPQWECGPHLVLLRISLMSNGAEYPLHFQGFRIIFLMSNFLSDVQGQPLRRYLFNCL